VAGNSHGIIAGAIGGFLVLRTACIFLLSILCIPPTIAAQQSAAKPAPGSAADLVEQGQQLSHMGRQDDALVLYNRALGMSPDLYEAHLAAGMALDLKGDYAAAQEHLTKAVDLAPSDSKQQAERMLAYSYTFAGDAFNAAKLEVEVFNTRMTTNDLIGAAEISNELGRIYLELGDPDHAYKWYKLGYETALRKPDLTDADKNLWLFRWEGAEARIAARRGQADEAHQHVVAAKAALDKANNPQQGVFYPYLVGYVALYTGDYKTAVAQLQTANEKDPLILALLGEAHEKSGDAAQARDCYRKVLEINTHNLTNAFARPLAEKKLAGAS
jgi:tetratricopeptide (TPR) repeat protein